MRPVILSRPANTAVGIADALRRRLDDDFVARPRRGIGRLRRARLERYRPSRPSRRRDACGGERRRPCGGWPGGGTATPGGGASGCDWMVPPPGRLDGGRLIGAGSGCAGG